MEDRIVLRVVARYLIPFIFVYGVYIQMHGEYSPGGGFQAGVICASAFILYCLIYGMKKTQQVLPPSIVKLLCCIGPLIYAGTGIISLLKESNFLNYSALAENAVSGQKMGIIIIELGVGITVFSVVMIIFYLFSERGTDT